MILPSICDLQNPYLCLIVDEILHCSTEHFYSAFRYVHPMLADLHESSGTGRSKSGSFGPELYVGHS